MVGLTALWLPIVVSRCSCSSRCAQFMGCWARTRANMSALPGEAKVMENAAAA